MAGRPDVRLRGKGQKRNKEGIRELRAGYAQAEKCSHDLRRVVT